VGGQIKEIPMFYKLENSRQELATKMRLYLNTFQLKSSLNATIAAYFA